MDNEMDNEFISYIFTIICMVFYGIVFIPQLLLIYYRKTSDGFSLSTVIFWIIAENLSLVGTALLNTKLNLIIIGTYYFILQHILLFLTLHYGKEKPDLYKILILMFVVFNLTMYVIIYTLYWTSVLNENHIIGYILSWISTIIYIIGRLPQIYLNNNRKSTHGLSMYMYIFSIIANIFLLLSILVYSLETEYLIKHLSWICFACFSVILDIIILVQNRIYKNIIVLDLNNIEMKSLDYILQL